MLGIIIVTTIYGLPLSFYSKKDKKKPSVCVYHIFRVTKEYALFFYACILCVLK